MAEMRHQGTICVTKEHYSAIKQSVIVYVFPLPVPQDISEPEEWEPFRFILALVAGFLGTIPFNPDPSGRIFGNYQDISEPTITSIRSSPLMNF